MWDYSEKLLDHFHHPRNLGEVKDADTVVQVGNIACGDALRLSMKVENGIIVDVKFKTFGCGSAIASASALTEMIKGKPLDEAEKITNEDIAEYLEGLPPEKMHCSVMGQEALQKAIAIYRGQSLSPEESEEYLCKCFMVTEQKIRDVAKKNGLRTVDEVTHYTKAGGGCGKCRDQIEAILKQVGGETEETPSQKPRRTNLQRIAAIQEVFEGQIRPVLQSHGGDAELVDIEANRVLVKLRGACSGCPHSGSTVRDLIRERLAQAVEPDLVVEEFEP